MVAKKAAATPPPDPESVGRIEIDRIASETLLVPIIGTAPLIVNKWSEKAKRAMLDKEQGKRKLKEIRNPEAEYEAAQYRTDDGGYGVPAVAFKAAIVNAARYYDKGVTMVGLRCTVFVHGELSKSAGQMLVRINGTPIMREDMVTVGQTTDLRYRPEFTEWSAELKVTYVSSCLSRRSVLSLIDAAGMGVGICEGRPLGRKSSRDFGTYAIDETKDVKVITS